MGGLGTVPKQARQPDFQIQISSSKEYLSTLKGSDLSTEPDFLDALDAAGDDAALFGAWV